MSSKLNILNVNDFTAENLVASTPKQLNPMGAKSVGLNYKFDEKTQSLITIQTPWMKSYGINKWVDEKKPDDAPKLSITLSFSGMEHSKEMQQLHTMLQSIDDWAIDYVHKNSWELLKTKNAPRDTIAFNYTRSFKTPVDRESGEPNGKPDNMKLKLTANKEQVTENSDGSKKRTVLEYSASFFTKDKTLISASEVESKFTMGSNVRALIQCTGFWIAAGKFGLSWKLKQMVIDPPSRIGKEYAFDDSDYVEPPVHQTKSTPVALQSASLQSDEYIANSDGETPPAQKEVPKEKEPEAENELSSAKKVVRKVVNKKL